MPHSHLTQWVEDADARQFCEAATWSRVPMTDESHSLHLGVTILRMPVRVSKYARAHLIASMSRKVSPDRQARVTGGSAAIQRSLGDVD
jgi:hypothetical protein